jgi:hypothetical protein
MKENLMSDCKDKSLLGKEGRDVRFWEHNY